MVLRAATEVAAAPKPKARTARRQDGKCTARSGAKTRESWGEAPSVQERGAPAAGAATGQLRAEGRMFRFASRVPHSLRVRRAMAGLSYKRVKML